MNPSAVALGRLVVTMFAVTLMGAGWVVATSSPVCSGGHYFGAFMVLAGGLLLVRMVQVARAPRCVSCRQAVDVSARD